MTEKETIKFLISEVDRLERKINRQSEDAFKFISDLTKALEDKGILNETGANL